MRKIMLMLCLSLMLVGCGRPTGDGPLGIAIHDISVEEVDGRMAFMNITTDEPFVPRGNNYVRLTERERADGTTYLNHSTFDTDQYDPIRVERALSLMHRLGYNTVRVFLNSDGPTGIGDHSDGEGLNPDYIANVSNFLSLAREHDIYVVITHDWLPDVNPYSDLINSGADPRFAGFNRIYLTPGGVAASQRFWLDFVLALRGAGSVSNVFAYELQNEFFFDTHEGPFNLPTRDPATGEPLRLETANGLTYNLDDPTEVERMRNENMLYFIDSITEEIKRVDPLALVTNGYFLPFFGDWRKFDTLPAIEESTLDFIDLHVYVGEFYQNWEEYVPVFGIGPDTHMPVLIGEFGAFRRRVGRIPGRLTWLRDNREATAALVDWQVKSCADGADGWLTWTWDTNEQGDIYSALGDATQGDQAVDLAVGPIHLVSTPVPLADPTRGYVGYVAYWLSPYGRVNPCVTVTVRPPP